MGWARRLGALVLALVLVGLAPSAQAEERRCFATPGIVDCIEGRFLAFWTANGGLPVFGYPLSPAREERTPEGTFLVQYFERQRFELHPELAPPFDVLLGRLGAELHARTIGDPARMPPAPPSANCRTFAETGRTLCPPFLAFWQANGLRDPALDGYGRSLALLGLPLTAPRLERNPDGDVVMTQWFERARLEDHGANGVLLGRLGAELATFAPSEPALPASPAHIALAEAINRERARVGAPPLALDGRLNTAAALSPALLPPGRLSHNGATGAAGGRMARAGYRFAAWAELIAAAETTPQSALELWLANPAQRRMLLDPALRELGIGGPTGAGHWAVLLAAP